MDKVIVNYEKPTASGHRTGWAKTFSDIEDDTMGAKAFIGGEYLREGENLLLVGTLVLYVEPVGSVKNGYKEASISSVDPNGLITPITGNGFNWRKEFESLRKEAKEVLKKYHKNEFEQVSMHDAHEVCWGILKFFSDDDRKKILNGLMRRSD